MSAPGPSGGRFDGRVVAVVGAGQIGSVDRPEDETVGNGRATALAFAREGATLLLVDRDRASAEATAERARGYGVDVAVFEADVEDDAQCSALVADAVHRFGALDVLVNNVGVAHGDGPIDQFDPDVFDWILKVNLRGMASVCKHALAVMCPQGRGAIVNMSSAASAIGRVPAVAYKASKAGVNALTQSVAFAGAEHGVRANALLIGRIATPAGALGIKIGETSDERDARLAAGAASVPLRRMGSGWDVANAAVFLASDDASFITGALLPIDGGETTL
jgi:NAD(P)-dependent dehydrogenase (short-subunit alcohol dehydrogenase family)